MVKEGGGPESLVGSVLNLKPERKVDKAEDQKSKPKSAAQTITGSTCFPEKGSEIFYRIIQ